MTYVCFSEELSDDRFYLLTFGLPDDTQWQKSKTGPSESQRPKVWNFVQYANGTSDRGRYSMFGTLEWVRLARSDPPTGRGKPWGESRVVLTIFDTELAVVDHYTNLSSTTTEYAFQIRRSTRRFTETITAPSADPKNKSKDRVTQTGHCTVF